MLHWTDLLSTLALVAAGSLVGYFLLLRRLKQIVTDRHMKVADQLAALDDAIRAMETRITRHHAVPVVNQAQLIAAAASQQEEAGNAEEEGSVAPEIQAVIAAATFAALGPEAHVRSVKPAASPWSQQGRVLVQGSHNLRVRG
jgi:hypothetical protein